MVDKVDKERIDILICTVCQTTSDNETPIVCFSESFRVCGGCLSAAVLSVYDAGRTLPYMEKELIVTREMEAEILSTEADRLAALYQSRLLEVRDPSPYPGEDRKASVTVPINRYTRDRIEALAREARLSPAQWVRRAIWLAFEVTAAPKKKPA